MRSRLYVAAGIVGLVLAMGGLWVGVLRGSSEEPNAPQPSAGGPTGESTVFRLQAPLAVQCGEDPVTAELLIDDLAAGGKVGGITGFQATIRFDPAILEVQSAELGGGLGGLDDPLADPVRRWTLAGPSIDNATGEVLFGGLGLGTSSDERRQLSIDPVATGQPILLGTLHFRTVGEGQTTLELVDSLALGDVGEEFAVNTRTTASISVGAGECAARAATPTPYAPPPAPTATTVPRSASRAELPGGLPEPPAGCEWVVSNPEPPILVILRYCGDEQTQWLFDTRDGALREATAVTDGTLNCAPSGQVPDPRCQLTPLPASPEPGQGCEWVIGNRETGWIDGDSAPNPPPAWDVLVEVCGDRASGRLFDPLTGELSQVTPRAEPVNVP